MVYRLIHAQAASASSAVHAAPRAARPRTKGKTLTTQAEMLSRIDTTIAETENLLSAQGDLLLKSFLKELKRYRALVSDHWPLTEGEKSSVDIGRVAVRELDDVYPEYTALLSRLGVLLVSEGSTANS